MRQRIFIAGLLFACVGQASCHFRAFQKIQQSCQNFLNLHKNSKRLNLVRKKSSPHPALAAAAQNPAIFLDPQQHIQTLSDVHLSDQSTDVVACNRVTCVSELCALRRYFFSPFSALRLQPCEAMRTGCIAYDMN